MRGELFGGIYYYCAYTLLKLAILIYSPAHTGRYIQVTKYPLSASLRLGRFVVLGGQHWVSTLYKPRIGLEPPTNLHIHMLFIYVSILHVP